jgi:molybdenum transport protein
MYPCALADEELARLLAEDVPYGDLTTEALDIAGRRGSLQFSARGAMCVCGSEEAVRLLELAGARARVVAPSGGQLAAGALILHAEGGASGLHRAWKTAQVLLETASGVATAAAAICAALQGAGMATPVACTRKNFPGTKALAAKAVRAGGATLHRLGLSETLLLFAEHRVFLAEPPAATVARLKARLPEKKLVVEVTSREEAQVWADAGADVLQLEKFSPEAVQSCAELLARAGRRPLLAAAGGISRSNAVAYACAGADLLVTSAPYFAGPADVQTWLVAA